MWLWSLQQIRQVSLRVNLRILPKVSIVDAKTVKSPAFRAAQASWASSFPSPSEMDFKHEKSLKEEPNSGKASSPPLLFWNTELRISMHSSQ